MTFCCLQVNTAPNPLAKEELNLLAKLMGGLEFQKSGNADSGFRVNLFATDEEEEWVALFMICMNHFFSRASFLLPRTKLDSPTTEIVALKSQGGVDFQTRWAFIWNNKHPGNQGKALLCCCNVDILSWKYRLGYMQVLLYKCRRWEYVTMLRHQGVRLKQTHFLSI